MAIKKKVKTPQKKKAARTLRDVWKRLPGESTGDEMRRMIAHVEYVTKQDNLERARYTAMRDIDFSLRGLATLGLDWAIQRERKNMLDIRRKALAHRAKRSKVPSVNAEKELKTDFSAVNLIKESRVFANGAFNLFYALDTRGMHISASEIARLPGFQMLIVACQKYDIDINLMTNPRVDLDNGEQVCDDEDGGKPEQNEICDPLFASYCGPNEYEAALSFNLGKAFDTKKWEPYIGAPDPRVVSFVVNSTTPAYALQKGEKPVLRLIEGNKAPEDGARRKPHAGKKPRPSGSGR